MNNDYNLNLTTELQHGISVDDIKGLQVLVLPENFNSAYDKESLIEASDSLNMSKIFNLVKNSLTNQKERFGYLVGTNLYFR